VPTPTRVTRSDREIAFEEHSPYERLLEDALTGEHSLFTRRNAVEAAWAVVDPVLDDVTPLYPYRPGCWGPEQAGRLTRRHGDRYNPPSSGGTGFLARRP